MKVLVTGGLGFIGSHLVDSLVDRMVPSKKGSWETVEKIVIVDNQSTGSLDNWNRKAQLAPRKVDIRDKKELEKAFAELRPDVVFHLAAQVSVIKSMKNPHEDLEINVEGTRNLIELAEEYGVRKFIFSSTGGAIYGDPQFPLCNELTPINPMSYYGFHKSIAEVFLRHSKLNTCSLRYANVFGPRQDPCGEAGVVSIFIGRMLKNVRPLIYGDGEQTRDFIFVSDVVDANLLVLDNDTQGVFNIGTRKQTSVNQLFEILKRLTGYQGIELREPEREGEVRHIALDYQKFNSATAWIPKVSLEQGLYITLQSFQK